jgi:cysteine desulfurase / selenocysteine lyase
MGSEIVKGSVLELPLWQRYADQFPVRENLVYLNHASVAPLPRCCADALKHLADDCLNYGSHHYGEWLAVYDGLRAAAARLVNADPREIALLKNTSEGIATIAFGLDWRPGDRMVGFVEEFPANLYPWKRLAAKGVEVTWLSIYDSLEKIDAACRGARLLAISFVQFLGGYRAPIQELGEICRRNDCIYFVDAIQGLGAFPLDVRACHIDALAADGHKWMLGPEGCAILFVNQALQ